MSNKPQHVLISDDDVGGAAIPAVLEHPYSERDLPGTF